MTSFLARLSDANYIRFLDVWKLINSYYANISMSIVANLDINYRKITNIYEINRITGLSDFESNRMSFSCFFDNFYGGNQSVSHMKDFMKIFDRKHRRFCQVCIEEETHYKLLWQIKEISCCEIHLCNLIDDCYICEQRQPYI